MKQECADAIQQAAGRQLSKAELDGIEERIRGALRELSMTDEANFLSMPPNERYAAAANLAKEWMLRDTVRAHEQALTEASRKAKLFADTAAVKPGLKGQVHYLKNELVNIEQRTNAVSANFFRQLQGLHEADGGKLFGMFQDPAKQRDIARGLFGEATTPEAKRAADSIKQLMNTVAERFQRAGLTLNKREDYRTPQPQDPMKASSAGKEQWINDHMQWVDRRAYVNADGTHMSDDQLRAMLQESWRSIATDGANKRGEASPSGGSALVGGNKNAPRQLFFKNSDAWSQAMQKYGRTSNMYELIGAHVRGMSKDIAMAETFGRQADKNYKQALAQAYEADHGSLSGDNNFKRLDTLRNKTERLFDAYVNPERPQNASVANAMANLRGLIASTQLGSLFGALPDLAGIKMAANYSGLPAMRVFRNLVDGMAAGAEKKDFLHKLGVWQEGFQHMQHRVVEDGLNNGWGNWLNELTHRMMGLNAFDRGMRSGIGRTVMDTLGKFTREHDTLASAEGEARMLQRRGVTEDHWAVWKKAELDKGYNGNERLLTPESIYKIPDAQLDPIIEQRVSQRNESLRAEIEKRNEQTAREHGWLQSKQENFNELRDRANRALRLFDEQRQGKIDSASDSAGAKAELLRARVEAAEVEHDIAGYLRTEKAQDRILAFLKSVENGASVERKVVRERVHADNMTDAVVQRFQKTAAVGERAAGAVEKYGQDINRKAEELGARRAQAEARIKAAEQRVADMQKSHDADILQRAQAADKRFKGIADEITTAAEEYRQRAAKRQEYADAFQAKAGKVLAEERQRAKDEAAEKLLEVAYGEMQYGARGASPSTVEDKVMLGTDKYVAGTVAGELNRFMLQFKSVPLGVFRQQWEAAKSLDGWGAKTAYMAKFAAYSMMMGALATEVKALINGQNPRNMNPDTPEGRKFWMESLAAGGGLGIYGDLFANGQTAAGAGLETLFGPGFSAMSDLVKEARQAVTDAENGESKHPYALKAVQWVRRNATPLMNLWYLKAAFNRLVYDNIQDTLAPGTSDKQRQRMEMRGASYWWAPGANSEMNTPDLSKAFE
ncbi:structural protein [Ralstonia phage RpY1]|nr:structural protein [Ralstonia phage RpY1]